VKRRLWGWGRLLTGAGIIAVLVWRLGTGAFLDALRVIDGRTLAAAFALGLLTTVVSAWRWCLVARGLGARLPLAGAVADYYRALFLNATLPGGVLGDVDRAVRHGRETGDVGRGVRAVVLERTAGQVVLVTVGVTVLVAYPSPVVARMHLGRTPLVVAGVAVALLAAAVLALSRLRRGARADRSVARRGLLARLRGAFGTGVSDVRRGLLARRQWPWIALSAAVVLLGHLGTFVLAARAVGSTAPVTQLMPPILLALLAMGLPIDVGGWGPREGVSAWAFGAAGLSATQGMTIAVVYGLFAFVASLPGAAVLIGRWLVRLREQNPPALRWVRPLATRLSVQPLANRLDNA
jgi:uncharacterized membrane protein YbhN (UPF0104 family)